MENYYYQIKSIVSGLETNKIAIIGKGPSISNVDLDKLKKDFIIINLNDSERVIPGDFSILHRSWSYQSVKENGFKSRCYITDLNLESVPNINVNYLPDTYDSIETTVDRLLNNDLYIADFLFLTAIKLSIIISDILEQKVRIYFLGFDFNIPKQQKPNTFNLYSDVDDLQFKSVFLKTQEEYFERVKQFFNQNESPADIIHVGQNPYSDISIEAFNTGKQQNIEYADIPEGYNSKLYKSVVEASNHGRTIIVAELTNNHIGDHFRLKEMVRLAKEAGADLIKVQKRNVETFYTQEELASPYDSPFGTTLRDYRTGVELDEAMFELLAVECYRYEIPWFATILDYASLEFIKQYDCPLLKIPSTISNHRNYIKTFSEVYQGDVVVSTGFTDQQYEEFILDLFGNRSNNLWLLQCTSSYPAPPEACQISVVRHYHTIQQNKYSNVKPGYSSHDIGSLGCMLAVAAGAKMLEKHVKLGNLDWVHFDGVALDLYNEEFKRFVKDIRKAEIMCGSEQKQIHKVEHHKYEPNKMHN